jgi:hypothetical protein
MRSRRAVWVWLLVVLLPVQASAVAWLAAAGPAHGHAHASTRPDGSESEALRLLVIGVGAAETAHAHAPGVRHHHAEGARRFVELDPRSALESDGAGQPDLPAPAAFLPIPAPQPVVHAPPATHALGARKAWTPTASELALDERPPR